MSVERIITTEPLDALEASKAVERMLRSGETLFMSERISVNVVPVWVDRDSDTSLRHLQYRVVATVQP